MAKYVRGHQGDVGRSRHVHSSAQANIPHPDHLLPARYAYVTYKHNYAPKRSLSSSQLKALQILQFFFSLSILESDPN